MRVKIQHSVNIADVEKKIINLLVEAMSDIEEVRIDSNDLLTLLGMNISHTKYQASQEMIHVIRERLALYDNVLNDASMIIDGLHRYHANESSPQQQPPQPESPPPSPEEVTSMMDNISERFANIKEELHNVDKG